MSILQNQSNACTTQPNGYSQAQVGKARRATLAVEGDTVGGTTMETTRETTGSQTGANKTKGVGTTEEGEADTTSNNCGLTTNTPAS
jgi:hypothetical protein